METDSLPAGPQTHEGLWRNFFRSFKPMFGIHLLSLAIGFILVAPACTFIVRQAVLLSGESALSDTDIASFVLSFKGALIAIAAAAVILTLNMIGYGALLVAARATIRGEAFTVLDALARVLTKLLPTIFLSLRFLFYVVLIVAPFLASIALIYFLTLRGNDINFYLSERPPIFILALCFSGILLIAMAVLLIRAATGWIHALPLVLFNDVPPREARLASLEAAEGMRPRISFILAVWLVLTPMIIGALNAPLTWLGLWAAPQLANRLPLLSFVIGAIFLTQAAIALLVGFISLSFLALQNVRLFRRAGLDTGLPTPASRYLRFAASHKTVTLAVLALLAVASFSTFRWIDRMEMNDSAVVIAHRGASGKAPENTMAAITQAVEEGAEWVEIDVQETADGVIVVFHDSDFKRLAGKNLTIWDARSEDLPDIDIGSWFDPEFADQRTPTLREALEACRDRSKVLIELKYYGHDEKLEERVIEVVEEAQMVDQVMVMSLKYEAIQKFRELRPDWKLGLLSTVAVGDILRLDIDFLGLNARAATPALIKRAHKAGIDVHVWTVNDAVSMSSMLSRGVDGLITDEPGLAAKVIAQRAGLSPAERLLIEITSRFGKPPVFPDQ